VTLLAWTCVAAAILPVVVATVRAMAGGWRAIGDNAFFGLRAADVLTEHHPLLGTWTSASLTIGVDVNNPGPLLFDALALPVRVGGPHAGLAVGVALVNIAAILGIAAVARRRGGAPAVVAAMAAATGLGWALGSELLFDPWQPHSLVFPALCYLFLVWALAAGDLVVLPWLVGVASLIVQTHVGYALLVPALGAWALAVAGVRLWRARSVDPDGWPAQRRRASRCVVWSLIVAVVCWAQPLVEQVFGEGRGNLARLVSSVGDTGDTVGVREAPRFVAKVLALPPWWGRPSVSEAFLAGDALPSLGVSLVGIGVVAGLLAVGLGAAWRRGDPAAAWAAATGLAVVGVALVAASTMPLGVFDVASHQVRWLWPVAVFVSFALVLPLVGDRGRWLSRAVVGCLALGSVTLSLLNLPSMNPGVGPASTAESIPTVGALLPQLAALRDEAGVLIDVTGERFAEPYTVPVMLELQRLGVPWFVEQPGLVRQVGPSRAHDGRASARLFLREGDAARAIPDGTRRVAFVEALSEAETGELATIKDDLRPFLTAGGLVMRQPAAAPERLRLSDDQLRDPDFLFDSRALSGLVGNDLLDVAPPWSDVLERYTYLQYRADRLTVAVFIEPLAGG
jgi:hypothetical protein